MKTFRAAVVQAAPVVFDLEATLDKLEEFARRAAQDGADLAVFPEAFVSAYPQGLDFGARIGMRSPEGRDDFLRYWESSIDVPGPATDRIGSIAKSNGLVTVVGVIEREGGTLYCTALFFGADGTILGKHRKLMPTASERLVWGFGDGSTLSVVDTPLGKLGAVICWENYMPLLRTVMYNKGIQLYCAPTADCSDGWISTMQHVAMEGRCFVFSAVQFLKRSDCPEDYNAIQGNDPDTVLKRGGSCIINPIGQILVGPEYGREAILTAEIELSEIVRGKYDFDVTGHYARPDIFRLHVNESPQPSVGLNSAVPSDPFSDEG